MAFLIHPVLVDNPAGSEQSRKRGGWSSSQEQRKGKGKENQHLETFTDNIKMSPGSVYLGPPSAYLSFSWWYSCTLQAAICERRGRALQDCMMDTVSKAIQESPTWTILYQPHMQHWGSPHLSANPSHVSCSTSPQVGATLEFAITCTSGGGCTHGRVPELLVSTLALAGRVSHQCHTATPATETLDKVGTQEQNHCRCFYVLIYDTCADMDSWSTWVPQRHRHSLMPVGTHA